MSRETLCREFVETLVRVEIEALHHFFEEWQGAEGRISSAVFRREAPAPGGVLWLHLHETGRRVVPESSNRGGNPP